MAVPRLQLASELATIEPQHGENRGKRETA
jgi:hypothetical protein